MPDNKKKNNLPVIDANYLKNKYGSNINPEVKRLQNIPYNSVDTEAKIFENLERSAMTKVNFDYGASQKDWELQAGQAQSFGTATLNSIGGFGIKTLAGLIDSAKTTASLGSAIFYGDKALNTLVDSKDTWYDFMTQWTNSLNETVANNYQILDDGNNDILNNVGRAIQDTGYSVGIMLESIGETALTGGISTIIKKAASKATTEAGKKLAKQGVIEALKESEVLAGNTTKQLLRRQTDSALSKIGTFTTETAIPFLKEQTLPFLVASKEAFQNGTETATQLKEQMLDADYSEKEAEEYATKAGLDVVLGNIAANTVFNAITFGTLRFGQGKLTEYKKLVQTIQNENRIGNTISDAIENVGDLFTRNIKNKTLRKTAQLGISSASEASEEATQTMIGNYVQAKYANELNQSHIEDIQNEILQSIEVSKLFDDIGYSAFAGGFGGGLIGAMGRLATTTMQRNNQSLIDTVAKKKIETASNIIGNIASAHEQINKSRDIVKGLNSKISKLKEEQDTIDFDDDTDEGKKKINDFVKRYKEANDELRTELGKIKQQEHNIEAIKTDAIRKSVLDLIMGDIQLTNGSQNLLSETFISQAKERISLLQQSKADIDTLSAEDKEIRNKRIEELELTSIDKLSKEEKQEYIDTEQSIIDEFDNAKTFLLELYNKNRKQFEYGGLLYDLKRQREEYDKSKDSIKDTDINKIIDDIIINDIGEQVLDRVNVTVKQAHDIIKAKLFKEIVENGISKNIDDVTQTLDYHKLASSQAKNEYLEKIKKLQDIVDETSKDISEDIRADIFSIFSETLRDKQIKENINGKNNSVALDLIDKIVSQFNNDIKGKELSFIEQDIKNNVYFAKAKAKQIEALINSVISNPTNNTLDYNQIVNNLDVLQEHGVISETYRNALVGSISQFKPKTTTEEVTEEVTEEQIEEKVESKSIWNDIISYYKDDKFIQDEPVNDIVKFLREDGIKAVKKNFEKQYAASRYYIDQLLKQDSNNQHVRFQYNPNEEITGIEFDYLDSDGNVKNTYLISNTKSTKIYVLNKGKYVEAKESDFQDLYDEIETEYNQGSKSYDKSSIIQEKSQVRSWLNELDIREDNNKITIYLPDSTELNLNTSVSFLEKLYDNLIASNNEEDKVFITELENTTNSADKILKLIQYKRFNSPLTIDKFNDYSKINIVLSEGDLDISVIQSFNSSTNTIQLITLYHNNEFARLALKINNRRIQIDDKGLSLLFQKYNPKVVFYNISKITHKYNQSDYKLSSIHTEINDETGEIQIIVTHSDNNGNLNENVIVESDLSTNNMSKLSQRQFSIAINRLSNIIHEIETSQDTSATTNKEKKKSSRLSKKQIRIKDKKTVIIRGKEIIDVDDDTVNFLNNNVVILLNKLSNDGKNTYVFQDLFNALAQLNGSSLQNSESLYAYIGGVLANLYKQGKLKMLPSNIEITNDIDPQVYFNNMLMTEYHNLQNMLSLLGNMPSGLFGNIVPITPQKSEAKRIDTTQTETQTETQSEIQTTTMSLFEYYNKVMNGEQYYINMDGEYQIILKPYNSNSRNTTDVVISPLQVYDKTFSSKDSKNAWINGKISSGDTVILKTNHDADTQSIWYFYKENNKIIRKQTTWGDFKKGDNPLNKVYASKEDYDDVYWNYVPVSINYKDNNTGEVINTETYLPTESQWLSNANFDDTLTKEQRIDGIKTLNSLRRSIKNNDAKNITTEHTITFTGLAHTQTFNDGKMKPLEKVRKGKQSAGNRITPNITLYYAVREVNSGTVNLYGQQGGNTISKNKIGYGLRNDNGLVLHNGLVYEVANGYKDGKTQKGSLANVFFGNMHPHFIKVLDKLLLDNLENNFNNIRELLAQTTLSKSEIYGEIGNPRVLEGLTAITATSYNQTQILSNKDAIVIENYDKKSHTTTKLIIRKFSTIDIVKFKHDFVNDTISEVISIVSNADLYSNVNLINDIFKETQFNPRHEYWNNTIKLIDDNDIEYTSSILDEFKRTLMTPNQQFEDENGRTYIYVNPSIKINYVANDNEFVSDVKVSVPITTTKTVPIKTVPTKIDTDDNVGVNTNNDSNVNTNDNVDINNDDTKTLADKFNETFNDFLTKVGEDFISLYDDTTILFNTIFKDYPESDRNELRKLFDEELNKRQILIKSKSDLDEVADIINDNDFFDNVAQLLLQNSIENYIMNHYSGKTIYSDLDSIIKNYQSDILNNLVDDKIKHFESILEYVGTNEELKIKIENTIAILKELKSSKNTLLISYFKNALTKANSELGLPVNDKTTNTEEEVIDDTVIGEDEEIATIDGDTNEKFTDDRVSSISDKQILSVLTKSLLSNISSQKVNLFWSTATTSITEKYSFDELYNDLREIVLNNEGIIKGEFLDVDVTKKLKFGGLYKLIDVIKTQINNYDLLIDSTIKQQEKRNRLNAIYEVLSTLSQDLESQNNEIRQVAVRKLNALITDLDKRFLGINYVYIDKNGKVSLFSVNSNSPAAKIKNEFRQNFKNINFDKKKIKELKQNILELSQTTDVNQRKKALEKIFKEIQLPLLPSTIDAIANGKIPEVGELNNEKLILNPHSFLKHLLNNKFIKELVSNDEDIKVSIISQYNTFFNAIIAYDVNDSGNTHSLMEYDDGQNVNAFVIPDYASIQTTKIKHSQGTIQRLENSLWSSYSDYIQKLYADNSKYFNSFQLLEASKISIRTSTGDISTKADRYTFRDLLFYRIGLWQADQNTNFGDVVYAESENQVIQNYNFDVRKGYYGFDTISDKGRPFIFTGLNILFHKKSKNSEKPISHSRMMKAISHFVFNNTVVPELSTILKVLRNDVEHNWDGLNTGGKLIHSFPQLNIILYGKENNLISFIKANSKLSDKQLLEAIIKKYGNEMKEIISSTIHTEAKSLIKKYNLGLNQFTDTQTLFNSNIMNEVDIEDDLNDSAYTATTFRVLTLMESYIANNYMGKGAISELYDLQPYQYSHDKKLMKLVKAKSIQDFNDKLVSGKITLDEFYQISDTVITERNKRLAGLSASGNRPNFSTQTYREIILDDKIGMASNIEYLAKLFIKDDTVKQALTEKLDTFNEAVSKLDSSKSDYNIKVAGLRQKLANELQELKGIESILPYIEITSSDAQEYTTLSETIEVLFASGKIDSEKYNKLKNICKQRIEFEANPENKNKPFPSELQLSQKDLSLFIQPMKPVYYGSITDKATGLQRIHYIKTSAIPLLPEFTSGTELDKLRIAMETAEAKSNILYRVTFSSGIKTGSINNPIKIFDISGNVILSSEELIQRFLDNEPNSKSYVELIRDNFKIQQEINYHEHIEITNPTQFMKLITSSVISSIMSKSFDYHGKSYSGIAITNEYWNKIDVIFKALTESFLNEFGLDNNGDIKNLYNEDGSLKDADSEKKFFNKIKNILITEAKRRNFPISEIQKLEVIEYQKNENIRYEFSLPLWASLESDRYEALLHSVFNKALIKYKIPGYSYVATTSSGFFGSLTESSKSNIVWITDKSGKRLFDNQLGSTHIESGQLKGNQILVPFRFKDEKGNVLSLKNPDGSWNTKFVDVNEETGIITLKNVDSKLLKSVGFRIPTSSHVSMAAFEIVGFLPEEIGDVIVVPDTLNIQMGMDYDIDKLYLFGYNVRVDKNKGLVAIDENYEANKKTKRGIKTGLDIDRTPFIFTYKNAKYKTITKIFDSIVHALLDHDLASKSETMIQNWLESQELNIEDFDNLRLNIHDFNFEDIDDIKEEDKIIVAKKIINVINKLHRESIIEKDDFSNKQKLQLAQNDLVDIYKSIMFSPNEEVQKRVNGVLNIQLARDATAFLDSKKKPDREIAPSVYSTQTDIENFFAGSAGKISIGIYSNAIVNYGIMQQLKVPLKYNFGQKPISVIGTNGKTYQIAFNIGEYYFTETFGEVLIKNENNQYEPINRIRSITEAFAERQNMATDNAKEKLMSPNGLSLQTVPLDVTLLLMGIDTAHVNVGTKSNPEYQDIQYSFLLFRNPIMQKIIAELENESVLSTNYQTQTELSEDNDRDYSMFTGQQLYDWYINFDSLNNEEKEEIENKLKKLYVQLKALTKEVNILTNFIGITKVGIGSTNSTAEYQIQKQKEIIDRGFQKEKPGFSNLIPRFTKSDEARLRSNKITISELLEEKAKEAITQRTGLSDFISNPIVKQSIKMRELYEKVFSKLFIFEDANIKEFISETISALDIKSNNKAKLFREKFTKSLPEYIFTLTDENGNYISPIINDYNVTLQLQNQKTFKSISKHLQIRLDLLTDTESHISLARYLQTLLIDLQEKNYSKYGLSEVQANALLNNYILKNLTFRLADNKSESFINFNKLNDDDEALIYNAFKDLLRIGKINLGTKNGIQYDTLMLTKDLMLYGMLNTNNPQNFNSFTKYIPLEALTHKNWFALDKSIMYFTSRLNTAKGKQILENYREQVIQHNPELLPNARVIDKSKKRNLIDSNDILQIKVKSSEDLPLYVKYKNKGVTVIYKYIQSLDNGSNDVIGMYSPIDKLGNQFIHEYGQNSTGSSQSVIKDNRVSSKSDIKIKETLRAGNSVLLGYNPVPISEGNVIVEETSNKISSFKIKYNTAYTLQDILGYASDFTGNNTSISLASQLQSLFNNEITNETTSGIIKDSSIMAIKDFNKETIKKAMYDTFNIKLEDSEIKDLNNDSEAVALTINGKTYILFNGEKFADTNTNSDMFKFEDDTDSNSALTTLLHETTHAITEQLLSVMTQVKKINGREQVVLIGDTDKGNIMLDLISNNKIDELKKALKDTIYYNLLVYAETDEQKNTLLNTLRKIFSNNNVSAIRDLINAYNLALQKKSADSNFDYYYSNIHEFIAGAMSDIAFIKELQSMKLSENEKKNFGILQKITEGFKKILRYVFGDNTFNALSNNNILEIVYGSSYQLFIDDGNITKNKTTNKKYDMSDTFSDIDTMSGDNSFSFITMDESIESTNNGLIEEITDEETQQFDMSKLPQDDELDGLWMKQPIFSESDIVKPFVPLTDDFKLTC